MKLARMSFLAVCTLLVASAGIHAAEPTKPTWESLLETPIPEWLKDAKFGVYTHWGVYSIPT